jgi:hypothetical protein
MRRSGPQQTCGSWCVGSSMVMSFDSGMLTGRRVNATGKLSTGLYPSYCFRTPDS